MGFWRRTYNSVPAIVAFRSATGTLTIAKASYGDNHPTVANILINLGIVKRLTGDVEGAKNDLERALDAAAAARQAARLLGEHHTRFARVDLLQFVFDLTRVATGK